MSSKKGTRAREALTHCSAWAPEENASFSWDARWGAGELSGGMGGDLNRPPQAVDFRQARRWARLTEFVGEILKLRYAFYNHGLLGVRTELKDPKNPESEVLVEHHPGIQAVRRADREKVRAWKKERRMEIGRYVRDAWMEWLTLDNAIGLWRRDGAPLVVEAEGCHYTDKFGVETLTITHTLSEKDIEGMEITAAEKTRLRASKRIEIRKNDPLFKFDVIKRERVGRGLAWPGLAALFHACATLENLQVADRALADACRNVYEQHACGYEIKSGMRAGAKDNHLKKPRAEAIRRELKNKKGRSCLVTNFDHKVTIGAGLPDPKQFDLKRYDGARERLLNWSMPLGQMLNPKMMNPFLMTLLRAQATGEREILEPHLHTVLTGALRPPAEIRLQWDNSVFWDSRLFLEVLKSSLTGGPLSQETFLEGAGFDRSTELERKQGEASLPMELKGPAWDPAHGKRPGLDDKGGKPAGTSDKS